MTLDEAIIRLESLREEFGGDTPLCVEKESIDSGRVNLFEPAKIEMYKTVKVDCGDKIHWVCLMNGNTEQVALVW